MDKETRSQYMKRWRAAHPGYSTKRKDKDKYLEYQRQWRKANPDYHKRANRQEREATPAELRRTLSNAKPRLPKAPWSRKHSDRKANRKRAAVKKAITDAIKVSYGCMNPGCQWAGELKPECLDFHHKDRATKAFNIGSKQNVTKVIAEIRKCVVLCAICHRLERYGFLDVSDIPLCLIDDEGKSQRAY